MADIGKLLKIPAGETILAEGEVNLDMYKIISGHAEVYMGYGTETETLIGIIGPNSCFGEFGLLLNKPAIYTVIAYSEVLLMRITKGEMGDFIQQNHKSVMDIMQNMAHTMMTMRTQIDMLINDLNEGKKLNEKEIHDLKKSIRPMPVMPKVGMEGKFHTLDMIRNR